MRLYILYFVIVLSPSLWGEQLALTVQAESAILINADTGCVLYEKNAHTPQYPASITKIATAGYALNQAQDKLDVIITAQQEAIASVTEEAKRRSNYTVPAYWLIPGGTHIGIKKGEELSLRTLLYGLLLASGNDAANVIAQHLGGTIPDFMSGLNRYLKEIGCQHTEFCNPHGLHHPKHLTTAYDMALIMRESLKNSKFRELIATVYYERPKTNKQGSTMLVQGNKLIRKGKFHYPKAIGGKTGYYSIAGHSLVVAAKHRDRTLVAVLMKTKERNDIFQDAIEMFEAAFNQPKVKRTVLKAGPQKMTKEIEGASTVLTTYLKEDVTMEYYPAEEPKFKCLLYWNVDNPRIAKDQQVGELQLKSLKGDLIQSIPLFSSEEVSPTWYWTITHFFS